MAKFSTYDKEVNRTIIVLAIAFSFMLMFYAPIEVYVINSEEFMFGMADILPIVLTCFLFFTGALFLLFNCLRFLTQNKGHKFENTFSLVMCLWFALFIALYIQGNYVPRNYGPLDGRIIDFSQHKSTAVASYIVWFATLAICLGVWFWFTKKSKNHFYKIIRYISLLICSMLLVSLLSITFTHDVCWKKDTMIMSKSGQNELSNNQNIVILLLDMFDTGYLEELLEEDETLIEDCLEDFTFYDNVSGGFEFTHLSVPYLLTGEKIEQPTGGMNSEYAKYVEQAYDDTYLLSELQNQGYSVCFYTSAQYLPRREGLIDNAVLGRYKITPVYNFTYTLYKLVLFEYLPQQLKGLFILETQEFNNYIHFPHEDVQFHDYSNELFYDLIMNNGVELVDEQKSFRFIHLNGMHFPYVNTLDVYEDGQEHPYNDTLIANIKIIDAYINALKAAGVYDKTEIYIMADHGADGVSEKRVRPLFLHKGVNEHHEFEISNMSLSYDDFYDSLLAVVENKPEEAMWNNSGVKDRTYISNQYKVVGNLAGEYDLIPINE